MVVTKIRILSATKRSYYLFIFPRVTEENPDLSNEEIAEAGKKSPFAAHSLAHRLVGLPLGGFQDGVGEELRFTEEKLPAELRRLSGIPSYSSQLLKRTADYLQQNGIRYYGLVVCGKPADLLKLQDNQTVAAAVMGAVAGEER